MKTRAVAQEFQLAKALHSALRPGPETKQPLRKTVSLQDPGLEASNDENTERGDEDLRLLSRRIQEFGIPTPRSSAHFLVTSSITYSSTLNLKVAALLQGPK